MAKKTIKLSQLSKDFAMKSKDVIDELKAINIDKNSSGVISDEEFEIFMQYMTKK